MSEYQYVAFRAIDAPVSDEDLEYMHEQSSRAEITPWSFENEYHYGDFHGNAVEMLRRGYDIHLHYANFGIRKLLLRLPSGLPDAKTAKPYLDGESLHFVKDKQGAGGILSIEPYNEPDAFEYLWNMEEVLDELAPLRSEILDGDLRPLYLAHLAVARDDNHDPEETQEAPVPAGMGQLTNAQWALARLYEIDDALVAAIAKESPPLTKRNDPREQYAHWLRDQPEKTKNAWLAKIMADPRSNVRTDMLGKFRKDVELPVWPTVQSSRTITQLHDAADKFRDDLRKKAAAKAERERAERLAAMADDPQPYLRDVDKLVAQRSTDSYQRASELLSELREALAGTPQADLPDKHAWSLKKKHPTLRHLTGALRRKGFVPKQ